MCHTEKLERLGEKEQKVALEDRSEGE